MFRQIKYRYLEWKWDRILKKSGLKTWENYFYRNDPGLDFSKLSLDEIFVDYPHVCLVKRSHLGLSVDGMWGPIFDCNNILNWCEKNCKKKFTHVWYHKVFDHASQYTSPDLDALAVGFKDERDYIWFCLKWQ